MIFDCNIKNTKEWDSIVKEFGEDEAYLTYILNDGNLIQDNELIDKELIDILLKNINLQKLVNRYREDKLVLGYYTNASIYLSSLANSEVKFHEAFHAIFDVALSSKEKTYYLNVANDFVNKNNISLDKYNSYVKENYLTLDNVLFKSYVLEEYLADKFSEFKLNKKQESFLVNLFNKLMKFIRYLLKTLNIEDLFTNINERKFNKYYSNKEFTQDKKFLLLRGKLLTKEDTLGLLILNSIAKDIFNKIAAQTIFLSKSADNKTKSITDLINDALNDYKKYHLSLYAFKDLSEKEINKNKAIISSLEHYIITNNSEHGSKQRKLLIRELNDYFKSIGALTYFFKLEKDSLTEDLSNNSEDKDRVLLLDEIQNNEEEDSLAGFDLQNDMKIFFQNLSRLIKDFITTITFNYTDYLTKFLNQSLFVSEKLNIPNIGVIDYFTVYSNLIQLFKEDTDMVNKLKKLYYASSLNNENDTIDIIDHLETTIFADYFFKEVLIDLEKLVNENKITGKDGLKLSDKHIDFLNAFFKSLTKFINNEKIFVIKKDKSKKQQTDSEETEASAISVRLLQSNSKGANFKQLEKWYYSSNEFINKYTKIAGRNEYQKHLTNAINIFNTYNRKNSKNKNYLFDRNSISLLQEIKKDAREIKKSLNQIGFNLDVTFITLSLIHKNLGNEVFKLRRQYLLSELLSRYDFEKFNQSLINYFDSYNLKQKDLLDDTLLTNIRRDSFRLDKETNEVYFDNQFVFFNDNRNTSKLKKVSSANVIFDESTKELNYKNAEGKRKNSIQNLTYIMSFISKLRKNLNNYRENFFKNGIREEYDKFELYENINNELVLSGVYQNIDNIDKEFVTENWLTKNLRFISNLDNLEYTTTDGFTIKDINFLDDSQSTFGKMSSDEGFISTLMLIDDIEEDTVTTENEKGETFSVTNKSMNVILKLLESSNTSVFVKLLYDDKISNELFYKYLQLEYERIRRVYKEAVKDGVLKTLKEIKSEIGYYIDRVHKVEYKDKKNLTLGQLTGMAIEFSKAIDGYFNKTILDNLLKGAYSDKPFLSFVKDSGMYNEINTSIDEFYNKAEIDIINRLKQLEIVEIVDVLTLIEGFDEAKLRISLKYKGLISDNLLNNLLTILKNHDANALWFNALLHGDHGLQYKNNMADAIKRAKLDNGAQETSNTILVLEYSKINTSVKVKVNGQVKEIGIVNDADEINSFKFVTFKNEAIDIYSLKANLYENLGKLVSSEKDLMDAQVYESLLYRLKFLIGSGRSSKDIADIIVKMIKGEDVNVEELFDETGTLHAEKTLMNLIKLVGGGSKLYLKATHFLLSFDLVGVKDEDGTWLLKLGKEGLFNMLITMLENGIDLIGLESAFKKMNVNTASYDDIINNKLIVSNTASSLNIGVQTELVSGKELITFFTQMGHIIDHEHELESDVFGRLAKEWIKDYQNQESNLFLNAYIKKMSDIYKYKVNLENLFELLLLDDEHVKIAMELFISKVLQTLNDQEGNQKLISILSQDMDKILLSVDNLYVYEKLIEYYYAHFNKGAFSQKINGRAFVINSSHGMNMPKIHLIKRDANGNLLLDKNNNLIKIWKLIRSGMKLLLSLTEEGKVIYDINALLVNAELFISKNIDNIKRFDKENLSVFYNTEMVEGEIFIDRLRYNVLDYDDNGNLIGRYNELRSSANTKQLYKILDTEFLLDVLTGFGTRIPSQDKLSAKSLRYVDLINLLYGDTCMLLDEVTFLDGGDHDGDKVFAFFLTYDSNFKEYTNDFLGYIKFVKEQMIGKLDYSDELTFKYLQKINFLNTYESYEEFRKNNINLNTAFISNGMIKSMQALLTYDKAHESKFTLSEDVKIVEVEDKMKETLEDYIKDNLGVVDDKALDDVIFSSFNKSKVSTLIYSLKAFINFFKDKTVGGANIGLNVKSNIVFTLLYKMKAHINKDLKLEKKLNFVYENKEYVLDKFNRTENIAGENIMDIVSALISISVDEASNKQNAYLGINVAAINFLQLLIQLGLLKEVAFMMFKLLAINDYIVKGSNKNRFALKGESDTNKVQLEKFIKEIESKLTKEEKGIVQERLKNNELLNIDLLKQVFLKEKNYPIEVNNSDIYFIYSKLQDILSITDKIGSFYFNLGKILTVNKQLLVEINKLDDFDDTLLKLFSEKSIVNISKQISESKFNNLDDYIHLTTSFRLQAKNQMEHFFGKLSYTSSEFFKSILNEIKNTSNKFNYSKNKRNIINQVNTFVNFRFLKVNGKSFGIELLNIDLIIDNLDNIQTNIIDHWNNIKAYYREEYTKQVQKEGIVNNVEAEVDSRMKRNLLIRNIVAILTIQYNEAQEIVGLNKQNKDGYNSLNFDSFLKRDKFEKKYIADEMHSLYHLNKDKYLKVSEAVKALYNYILLQSGFSFVNNSFYEYMPNEMDTTFSKGKKFLNLIFSAKTREEYIVTINSLRRIIGKEVEDFSSTLLDKLEKIAYQEYFGYENKESFIKEINLNILKNNKNGLILFVGKDNKFQKTIKGGLGIIHKVFKKGAEELDEENKETIVENKVVKQSKSKTNLLEKNKKLLIRFDSKLFELVKYYEDEESFVYEYKDTDVFSIKGLAYETGLILEFSLKELRLRTDIKHKVSESKNEKILRQKEKARKVIESFKEKNNNISSFVTNNLNDETRDYLNDLYGEEYEDVYTNLGDILLESVLTTEELGQLVEEYVSVISNTNNPNLKSLKNDLLDVLYIIENDITELEKVELRNNTIDLLVEIKDIICNS